jgi:hypothetical protein
VSDNLNFKEVEFEAFEKERQAQKFEELSRRTIGAAIQVHSSLGPGFLESIYEEAMKLELREQNLRFECQKEIKVEYLGIPVGLHRSNHTLKQQGSR